MGIAETGWLPAGVTGHSGIHRLLPNHALDLVSLRPRHVWRGATRTGTPPGVLVDRVAEIATRTTLYEAQVLIERWRRHYNATRPHLSTAGSRNDLVASI